jgi:hypothetical protein
MAVCAYHLSPVIIPLIIYQAVLQNNEDCICFSKFISCFSASLKFSLLCQITTVWKNRDRYQGVKISPLRLYFILEYLLLSGMYAIAYSSNFVIHLIPAEK